MFQILDPQLSVITPPRSAGESRRLGKTSRTFSTAAKSSSDK
jgi:hypothetical protein